MVVALGSNRGDSTGFVLGGWQRVIRALALQHPQRSALIVSRPAEGAAGADFVNAVGLGWTHLQPHEILTHLQAIETDFGRDRQAEGFHGARTLDLDLIDFAATVVQLPSLILPHPRMHLRDFVLLPLAQIAPDFVHPHSGLSLPEMIAKLQTFSVVPQLPDI